jgi:carbon monoxide dehydrogenase subunit G
VTSIAHIQFAAAIQATITERVAPERLTALIEGEDTLLGSALRVDAALFLANAQVAETMVSYTLDVALRGRLGRLGEPIFRRKSRDMEAEFARRFRERLKAATNTGGITT